jgi:hypothetical protein
VPLNPADILESIEKYARAYLHYIVSAIGGAPVREHAGEFDPKLLTFGLVSLVVGNFLYADLIRHTAFSQTDAVTGVFKAFSVWLVVIVALYFVINRLRKRCLDFNNTLSAVLCILPVAFLVSAFTGNLVYLAIRGFTNNSCAGLRAYGFMVVFEGLITFVFMVRWLQTLLADQATQTEETTPARSDGPSSMAAAGGVVLSALVVSIVVIAHVLGTVNNIADSSDNEYKQISEDCAMNGNCIKREFLDWTNGFRDLRNGNRTFSITIHDCKQDENCVVKTMYAQSILDHFGKYPGQPADKLRYWQSDIRRCDTRACLEYRFVRFITLSHLLGMRDCLCGNP